MATNKKILVAFPRPIVILGFGSIGQAVLPLLLRHIEVQPSQVTIIAKDEDGIEIAKKYGMDTSGSFVNGILDRIAHEARPSVG